MKATRGLAAVGLIGALALPGCNLLGPLLQVASPPKGADFVVPAMKVSPPTATGAFRVGAAKVDITPPPGFPTGGHGPAGNVARGHWTRLFARAFYFEDARGQALALVSCDLFAIPVGLQRLAAQRVAERDPRLSLPPDRLVVAATHTHQSPGNYMTSPTFNQFASSYPGFSAPLLEFLADGVATAVLEAARAKVEATELLLHAGPAAPIVLNRSPEVFLLNRDAEEVLAELAVLNEGASKSCEPLPEELEDGAEEGWGLPGCPRLDALDRRLAVLEARAGTGAGARRVALLTFFATHPTALFHDAPLYASDFSGLAVSLLEKEGLAPVVGFFNGAEGDVTTRRTRRDLLDVASLARLYADSVKDVLGRPGRTLGASPTVEVASMTVQVGPDEGGDRNVGKLCVHSSWTPSPRLSAFPKSGVATLGGAERDRTTLYDLGWREGVRDLPRRRQGPKLGSLDSPYLRELRLTEAFGPPSSFPKALPFRYVTLGALALAAVPAELSTYVGWEIKRALVGSSSAASSAAPAASGDDPRSRPPLPRDFVQLVGLANEYVFYVASRDEYMRQDYMGASTLLGPDEGAFFGCTLSRLRDGASEAPNLARLVYAPGPSDADLRGEPFGPAFLGDLRRAPDEELEEILRTRDGAPARRLPWFTWDEWVDPDLRTGDDFRGTARRRVSMERLAGASWTPWTAEETPDDGSGSPFLTTLLYGARVPDFPVETPVSPPLVPRPGRLVRRFAAQWLAPLFETRLDGTYRFRVNAGDEAELCSEPFRLDAWTGRDFRVEAASGCAASAAAPTTLSATPSPEPPPRPRTRP